MIHIKKSDILNNIEIYLLVLILNINIIRTITGVEQSIIYYLIYFLYIFTIFFHKVEFKMNIYFFMILFIIFYALLLSIPKFSFEIWIKLLISIMIGFRTFLLNKNQNIKALKYTIIVNIIFSIICIFDFNFIFSRMINNTENYLNISLPIAFSCNVVATIVLLEMFKEKKMLYIIYFFILIIALLRFSARGNIIFIVINILFISIINLVVNSSKLVRKFIFSLCVCILVIYIYFNYASNYDVNRMLRIFIDVSNEPRMILYINYIGYLKHSTIINCIFGHGVHSSYDILGIYPHNMFLEIFGELGVIGLLSVFIFFIKILKNVFYKILSKKIKYDDKKYILLTLSCFIFYFLIFNKSYSIYDGYQLFICIAMLLKSLNNVKNLKYV